MMMPLKTANNDEKMQMMTNGNEQHLAPGRQQTNNYEQHMPRQVIVPEADKRLRPASASEPKLFRKQTVSNKKHLQIELPSEMEVAPPYELPNLYIEVSRKLNKGVSNAKKIPSEMEVAPRYNC